VIIGLLLEQGGEDLSTSDKILKLSALGLGVAEIASLMRKPSNYVSAVLTRHGKRDKK
jgi:hypothetical protein